MSEYERPEDYPDWDGDESLMWIVDNYSGHEPDESYCHYDEDCDIDIDCNEIECENCSFFYSDNDELEFDNEDDD